MSIWGPITELFRDIKKSEEEKFSQYKNSIVESLKRIELLQEILMDDGEYGSNLTRHKEVTELLSYIYSPENRLKLSPEAFNLLHENKAYFYQLNYQFFEDNGHHYLQTPTYTEGNTFCQKFKECEEEADNAADLLSKLQEILENDLNKHVGAEVFPIRSSRKWSFSIFAIIFSKATYTNLWKKFKQSLPDED